MADADTHPRAMHYAGIVASRIAAKRGNQSGRAWLSSIGAARFWAGAYFSAYCEIRLAVAHHFLAEPRVRADAAVFAWSQAMAWCKTDRRLEGKWGMRYRMPEATHPAVDHWRRHACA